MIRVTKTFIKPDASTDLWFNTPAGAEFSVYRLETYGSKIANFTSAVSNDGLTYTFSVTWASREEYDKMMADPVIISSVQARKDYHNQVGIFEGDNQIVNL